MTYQWVVDPGRESAISLTPPDTLSTFQAPTTVRVSASATDGKRVGFAFCQLLARAPDKAMGDGIQDEKPISTSRFAIELQIPANSVVHRVEFLTPEQKLAQVISCEQKAGRLRVSVPPFLVYGVLRVVLHDASPQAVVPTKRIAAVVTEYRHNSHADVIVSRLLQTDTLDGQGRKSPLELVSLYVDQRPDSDLSRQLAASHGFRLSDSIADALTLGTEALAVDGVLLIAEHGNYPRSATTNTQYPKRRFWNKDQQYFSRVSVGCPCLSTSTSPTIGPMPSLFTTMLSGCMCP